MGALIFAIALCSGPLLPVWMFVNSLQLIVHIPLVRTEIPAVANLLFLDYLSIVRLNVRTVNDFLAQLLGLEQTSQDDQRSLDQADSYYNELIYSCGYHVSLTHNLILILGLFSVIALFWLAMACRDKLCFQGGRHEIWWNNLMVRFLYEVFFEITLCLMISFSAMDLRTGGTETKVSWGLSVVLTIAAVLALCYLSLLFVRGGPYIEGSYES